MRLFHSPGSRSTRILWALEETGAPYEVEVVQRDDKGSPEHLARHPLGKVPVLELDDGQMLFESAAICLQLGDLYPESGLMPELGSDERGRAYQWTFFAMTELEPRVFAWLFAKRRGEDVSHHAEAFAPLGAAMEEALGRGEWIAGDRFTAADILCASMVSNAFNRELVTGSGPLRDYFERALSRPASLRADARN
jgi:glutathione S-transferase